MVNASFVELTWRSSKPSGRGAPGASKPSGRGAPKPSGREAFNLTIDVFHLLISTKSDGPVEPIVLDPEIREYALTDLGK